MGRTRGRSRRRAMGLLALLSLAASIAMLAVAASGAWAMYAQDPFPIAPGDRVTLSQSGLTLLRDEGETAPASCRLRRDAEDVLLEEVGGQSVELQTGAFEVAAATPGRVSPGTYDFTCSRGGEGLYAARRVAFADAALVGAAGTALFAAALVLGTLAVLSGRRPLSPRDGSMAA